MAAVTSALRRVESGLELHGESVALPVGEAARERDDVLVAEVGERLGGESRAVAGRAVDDDGAGGGWGEPLGPGLEMPARPMDGPRDVALGPLVLLPNVGADRVTRIQPA